MGHGRKPKSWQPCSARLAVEGALRLTNAKAWTAHRRGTSEASKAKVRQYGVSGAGAGPASKNLEGLLLLFLLPPKVSRDCLVICCPGWLSFHIAASIPKQGAKGQKRSLGHTSCLACFVSVQVMSAKVHIYGFKPCAHAGDGKRGFEQTHGRRRRRQIKVRKGWAHWAQNARGDC